MKNPLESPRLAGAVSYASTHTGPAGRLMIGGDKRVVPITYHGARAITENDSLAVYPGDPNGTKLPWPRKYKKVGQTAVDIEALDKSQETLGADWRLVVAWWLGRKTMEGEVVVGGSAMVGVLPDEEAKALRKRGYYGMRIGHWALTTAVGWYLPPENMLVVPPGVVTAGSMTDLADPEGFPADGPIY
jgi:hypothetical protein